MTATPKMDPLIRDVMVGVSDIVMDAAWHQQCYNFNEQAIVFVKTESTGLL